MPKLQHILGIFDSIVPVASQHESARCHVVDVVAPFRVARHAGRRCSRTLREVKKYEIFDGTTRLGPVGFIVAFVLLVQACGARICSAPQATQQADRRERGGGRSASAGGSARSRRSRPRRRCRRSR